MTGKEGGVCGQGVRWGLPCLSKEKPNGEKEGAMQNAGKERSRQRKQKGKDCQVGRGVKCQGTEQGQHGQRAQREGGDVAGNERRQAPARRASWAWPGSGLDSA